MVLSSKMPSREVCRGCLAVLGTAAPALSSSTAEAYETLIGIPLAPVYGFPVHLCSFCLRTLHRCLDFKARCHKVLDILLTASTQDHMATKEYTTWLTSSYPVLKHQYTQTKTLTVELESKKTVENDSPLKVFKHEIENVDFPIAFYKEEKISDNETDTRDLDERIYNNTLEVENVTYHTELAKPCEVYIKYYNASNKTVDRLKKNRKRTLKTVKLKGKRLKKQSKSETQIVTEYAKSAGFNITFLTRAEQIREVDEKKKGAVTNGIRCGDCGKIFRCSEILERHKKHYHVLEPNSFMCDICSCVFHNKRALRAHVTGHSYMFTCLTCNFKTKQRAVLRKHQYYHKGKMFRCKYCAKVFDKHATYFSHVRLLHAAELPSCDLCGEFFNSEKGVDTHKKLSHNLTEEFPTVCSICKKRFKCDGALERHTNVRGCNLPSCAQCGDFFIVNDILKHHLVHRHLATTPPDTFDCDLCHTRFYNAQARACHICDAKAVCVQCGGHFESSLLLAEHFAGNHHIFKCEECGKQFTNAMYFKRHYATCHTAGRADQRGKPGQTKARKYPLQSAVRTWSVVGAADLAAGGADQLTKGGAQAVMCEICGKYVKNTSELKSHQLSQHSAAARFSCAHCRRGFKRKDLLQTHERVHTGERPYPCPQCPKAFKTYPACRRHLLVHTGERRHVCSECGKAFQLSTSVKWHIKTAHLHLPWPKRNRRQKQNEQ